MKWKRKKGLRTTIFWCTYLRFLTRELERDAHATRIVEQKVELISVVYKTDNVVLIPIWKRELRAFGVNTSKVVEWKCILLLISYWFDIPACKDISAVGHAVPMKRPCGNCTETEEDIISDWKSCQRLQQNSTSVLKTCIATPRKRTLVF